MIILRSQIATSNFPGKGPEMELGIILEWAFLGRRRRHVSVLRSLLLLSLFLPCEGQVTTALPARGGRPGYLPENPRVVHLNERVCPPYRSIGGSKWIPSALEEAVDSIQGTRVTAKKAQVSKFRHLVLLEYEYDFKPGTMFGDKETFQHIVDKPTNVLLWGPQATDGCNGYLSGWKLHKIAERNILELEFFTGGTGGFWEEYYALGADRLVPIREAFAAKAKELIPKNYGVRRTLVDIENMTCTVLLSTDSDANCCPSGRLDLRIRLEGNALEFVSGAFSGK